MCVVPSRQTRHYFKYALVIGLAALALMSCGWPFRGGEPGIQRVLTTETLVEIHRDIRFTRFSYGDGRIESGLMLNWMPDSIRIQRRGEGEPAIIPTSGLARIETVTGNRMFEGLMLGGLTGAAYFLAVGGHDLGEASFGEALVKVLVPPAMVIAAMGFGAASEKAETYMVPPDFVFDYENARRTFIPGE
jgi:hypothetical protein